MLKSIYRFYNAEALQRLPPGTVFEHQTLGKCILLRDSVHGRKMVFKSEHQPDFPIIATKKYPWNIPMRMFT